MIESVCSSDFVWSDAFLLGYGPMDDVHREFVDTVREMQCAPDDGFAARLDTFAAHAKTHFDEENAWMIETDFPARECHMNEHAAVTNSIEQVRQRVAQGDIAIGRKLAAELERWFPGHADYLDSALAHWMCKRRLGGKPVVIRRNILVHASGAKPG